MKILIIVSLLLTTSSIYANENLCIIHDIENSQPWTDRTKHRERILLRKLKRKGYLNHKQASKIHDRDSYQIFDISVWFRSSTSNVWLAHWSSSVSLQQGKQRLPQIYSFASGHHDEGAVPYCLTPLFGTLEKSIGLAVKELPNCSQLYLDDRGDIRYH